MKIAGLSVISDYKINVISVSTESFKMIDWEGRKLSNDFDLEKKKKKTSSKLESISKAGSGHGDRLGEFVDVNSSKFTELLNI